MSAKAAKNVAVITTDELRRIREETEKAPTRKAAMLPSSDVERMKASAKISTKEDTMQQKKVYA